MLKNSLLLIAFCAAHCCAVAQVYINEICPANADINYDPDYFNFSPWVELYNDGSAPVNVGGYYLSDKTNNPAKWRIPSGTSIPSKGFLVIWCDEMNSRLHTNFSLDSEGEDVVLSDAGGLLVDRVSFGKQHTNISYGRTANAGATWMFLSQPTPGGGNAGAGGSEKLDEVQFSVTAGRYGGAQTVTLTHPRQGVSIRYTRDGSEPGIGSTLYNGPVPIASTTILKAKAFLDGFIPGETAVATYLIGEHSSPLPVISISTKPDYLWNNTIGIYTDGTNGALGNCQETPKNWNQDWDRHAVLEYLQPNGQRRFAQHVDIRIGGGCSRGQPQKSFAVKARDKYGSNTIGQKLFDTKESNKYGGFMYRNSGNDFNVTMFRDALLQHLVVGQMDVDYLAYQPTIIYLNGEYRGIQNLREKIDADYIESNYGVDKKDLDLLEGWGYPLEGTGDAYAIYLDSLQQINLQSAEAFKFIDRHIDVQEFINYTVTEIYVANTDWPGNNIKYWRQRSTNGKFRWILWDMDFGFGLYTDASYPTHPTLNFATDPNSGVGWPNPDWSTLHLRLLLQNPTFRNRFIQTFSTAMETTFNPTRVNQLIDEFKNRIASEMPFHKQRWWGTMSDWNYEIQRLKDFSAQRHVFMRQHLADFFGLNELVTIDVKSSPENLGAYELNGVTSDHAITNAKVFSGLPVTVLAKPDAGYAFRNWKVTMRTSSFQELVTKEDTWKYFDQGAAPADWSSESFNDGSWAEGQAQLGYGEGDEHTVVGYGGDTNNKFITTYFRKTVNVSELDAIETISAAALFDDGIVVYVNGTEVFRDNMPGGVVNASTLALGAIAVENAFTTFQIDKSVFKSGPNVVAVEVHQNGGTSSDVSFDFMMSNTKLGEETSFNSTDPVFSALALSNISLEATFDTVVIPSGLVINEFCAGESHVHDDFDEKEDWIELLNTGTTPVDLAGLYITDNPAIKTKYQFPAGSGIIQPGEYKILWADEDSGQGPLHLNFKLSADGEAIGLYQINGSSVVTFDQVSFGKQQDYFSSSRIPNGTGPFASTLSMTPGEANTLTVSVEEDVLSGVSVSPNPAKENIHIRSEMPFQSVHVLNIYGQQIYTRQATAMDLDIVTIDFTPGLYFIRVELTKGSVTKKVVKE